MTDEEKKAIEYLKRHIIPCYGRKGTIEFMLNDIVLNLIEKQSKEIEELKEINNETVTQIYIRCSKKFRDKIKAKIEVMNTNIINAEKFDCDYIGQCRFAKYVLQSLLEKE